MKKITKVFNATKVIFFYDNPNALTKNLLSDVLPGVKTAGEAMDLLRDKFDTQNIMVTEVNHIECKASMQTEAFWNQAKMDFDYDKIPRGSITRAFKVTLAKYFFGDDEGDETRGTIILGTKTSGEVQDLLRNKYENQKVFVTEVENTTIKAFMDVNTFWKLSNKYTDCDVEDVNMSGNEVEP